MARRTDAERLKAMPGKDADNAVRLQWIEQDYWIGYNESKTIRDRLLVLLNYPSVTRLPGISIIGKPHAGKSKLLEQFLKENTPELIPGAEVSDLPILLIDCPTAASDYRLLGRLLQKLGMSGPKRETIEAREERLDHFLKELGVRMIIIDETNRALTGRGAGIGTFLNAIRDLGKKHQIVFVLAGTEQVLNLLSTDAQMMSRFPPHYMKVWKDDVATNQMLVTISSLLPLRGQINITGKKAQGNIVTFSEGLLGEMVEIVRALASEAITSGKESILLADITLSNLRSLGYIPPSRRNLEDTRAFG